LLAGEPVGDDAGRFLFPKTGDGAGVILVTVSDEKGYDGVQIDAVRLQLSQLLIDSRLAPDVDQGVRAATVERVHHLAVRLRAIYARPYFHRS
jgi:hypothetical protein